VIFNTLKLLFLLVLKYYVCVFTYTRLQSFTHPSYFFETSFPEILRDVISLHI